jgi:hypothetical protein
MSQIRNRPLDRAKRGAFSLLVAILFGGGFASGAVAQVPVPGGGATNLEISGATARLVGGEALIGVECEGPSGSLCSGTLSVASGGGTVKAPYSVYAGSHQNLAVTVGDLGKPGHAAIAVASTAQSSGGFTQSRAVLRFR